MPTFHDPVSLFIVIIWPNLFRLYVIFEVSNLLYLESIEFIFLGGLVNNLLVWLDSFVFYDFFLETYFFLLICDFFSDSSKHFVFGNCW